MEKRTSRWPPWHVCSSRRFATVSCDKNTDNGGERILRRAKRSEAGDGSKDNFEIASDMTLTYPNVYTLKGFVYVPDGVT